MSPITKIREATPEEIGKANLRGLKPRKEKPFLRDSRRIQIDPEVEQILDNSQKGAVAVELEGPSTYSDSFRLRKALISEVDGHVGKRVSMIRVGGNGMSSATVVIRLIDDKGASPLDRIDKFFEK